MVQYITNLSKYFITIFILLYTLECFLVFSHKKEKARRGCYIRQIIYLILIHFFCFLNVCLKTGETKYLIFYLSLSLITLSAVEVMPIIYRNINRLLINNLCMLSSIGLVMLVRLNYSEALMQLIIISVSFAVAGFIPFTMKKLKKIPNNPYIYALIGIVALALTYLLGNMKKGSKLSVSLFGFSFMPSEFVKISFVFFVAGMLYLDKTFKNLVITTILAAIHVILLVLSNDLGAALILYVVYVLMVFIATRSFIYLGIGTLTGCGAAYLSYILFRHIQVRVQAFLDPFSVIDNEGYQITQSLFALSSGSWFGMGLFEGTPETIPYVETDIIFSAITQEFGIVFGICLILICLSCFIMCVNISFKMTNDFNRLISAGLGISYIFQIFLTIGGGTKFIPLTGVTLPLISAGGSSCLATIISFFIIEGLYVIRVNDEKEITESRKKFINKTNETALGIVYLFIALFLSLIIYLVLYVHNNKIELINNSYNPVQKVLLEKNVRGSIYSRDLEILAETKVDIDGNETRFYPFYNIFSHIVGYSTKGTTGIEAIANYYLINSNQPISERMTADFTGDKYLGDGVVTTLDTKLQEIVYNAIGTYSGAVIVSNPKTGEILAMVSKPDYDPNEIEEIWNDLINDKESSVLLNRALLGLYSPGATFKIITLLEYIRENLDTYTDYTYNCLGKLKLDAGNVTCYNHKKHGNLSLMTSFAKSCNCSFGNICLNLDREKFSETLKDLMFNDTLPLTSGYSKSSIESLKDFDELTMVQTALGQGETLMTPIHVNLITQAIANKGVLMKPYVVSSVVNSAMNTVTEFSAGKYRQLMTEAEATIISEMMRAVVTSGSARKLDSLSFGIAGKTGSLESSDNTSLTNSWFTGFAPYEDPQICVTILLENAGSGNQTAVSVAKKIFEEYFKCFDTSEYADEE